MESERCLRALPSRAGHGRLPFLPRKALGFDENRANTLLASDGVLTGDVGVPIPGD